MESCGRLVWVVVVFLWTGENLFAIIDYISWFEVLSLHNLTSLKKFPFGDHFLLGKAI